ncbi:MAG: hypothetical protein RSC93_05070 [Erysipelotrichaceae bacterium]
MNKYIYKLNTFFLEKSVKINGNYDFEDNMKFMNSLYKKNMSDFERSFSQYLCQTRNMSKSKKIILNGMSVIYIIFMLLRINNKVSIKKTASVFVSNGLSPDYLPANKEIYCHKEDGFYLSIKDRIELFKRAFKLILHPYFIAKVYKKISIYRYVIKKYDPTTIYSSCEYSFTCSILTNYLNKYGVKHINIQHGEKLLYIIDAFAHFDIMYTWDSQYIEIFNRLKWKCNEYIVNIPKPLIIRKNENQKINFDFKYYLQDQEEDELDKIFEVLLKLKNMGYSVAVRQHPLFKNKYLEKKYEAIIPFDNEKINFENSILETNSVISQFSTVLLQAELNNKTVVIDDFTNPELFSKLKKLNYIVLNKKILKLSDIINAYKDK